MPFSCFFLDLSARFYPAVFVRGVMTAFVLFVAGCTGTGLSNSCCTGIKNIAVQTKTTPCCDIAMQVPEFCRSVAGTRDVKEWLESEQRRFLDKARMPDAGHPKNNLIVTLDRKVAVSDFLSLKFNVCSDMGGAHPNTYMETFVLDIRTGSRIFLSGVFADMDDALAMISPAAVRRLASSRACPMTDMEKAGLRPVENNFKYFVLEKTGIRFFFPVYQTGPRSIGEQAVLVTYPEIRHFMTPKILNSLHINK